MCEDSVCFDPNAVVPQGTNEEATDPSEDCFSQMVSDPPLTAVITTETHNHFAENVSLSMESPSYPLCGEAHAIAVTNGVASSPASSAMEIIAHHHQQQMGFDVEKTLMEEQVNNHGSIDYALSIDQSNSEYNTSHHHQNHDQNLQFPYCPTPDLLNLLHLPRSPASNSTLSFVNPQTQDTTNLQNTYNDPFLHLNLPTALPPPEPRDLFQSLPHDYHTLLPASRNDFYFGGGDNEANGIVASQDHGDIGRDFDDGVASVGKNGSGKRAKRFTSTTERQRRVDLTSKFDALKELIPNLTKNDRASVVGDAIEYIRELLRTVNELKLLVEKKRYEKQRIKRHKIEEDATTEGEIKLVTINEDSDMSYNESLRSSWIQRKSKDTEVDVRIIDNEVTIKLVQRKKINCLLYASQVMDELKLDLQHVAGGHIGDFSSFMFNSKICDGSSVYASAIANKLIEVMDRSLAEA